MKIGRLIAAAAGVAVLASTLALTGCSNDNEKYVNVYTVEGGNPLAGLATAMRAAAYPSMIWSFPRWE